MIPLFASFLQTPRVTLARVACLSTLIVSSYSYANTAIELEKQAFPTLHKFLSTLTPDVDTSLPATVKQTVQKVRTLLDQQQAAEALQALDEFTTRHPDLTRPFAAENVQFLFLRARALEQLKQDEQAFEIYSRMTEQYPELPEPWNNLAALYYKQGEFDLAIEALNYALRINPDFASARRNLAQVYLAKAEQETQRSATPSSTQP